MLCRDGLTNAISGGHDIHIGKLLAQEDLKRQQSSAKITNLVKSVKEDEWLRNRGRIAEIITLREKNKKTIDELKDDMTRVEEEFY